MIPGDDSRMTFSRFAIYYLPPAGDLADITASWLGWDPVAGRRVAHPDVAMDVEAMTRTPRKYGFHGTIKPPFALAQGYGQDDLVTELDQLAARQVALRFPGLRLDRLGGFLALVPEGDTGPLSQLAAAVVSGLDLFRAPMTEAGRARRRPESLSPRQRALLDAWGYPYVMEEFRFHLTLSGDLDAEARLVAENTLQVLLEPVLPRPFVIEELCLLGEAEDGYFHLLHRAGLG